MNPDRNVKVMPIQQMADLSGMVRIAKPGITWEQLTQAPQALPALKKICQSFQPGHNLMCLFTGARGKSQTLAFQAIAHQMGKTVVRVDLSAVVSKYIGETEKNLQRVFDSVKPQDTLLFFDEADALFGQRTEVQDSHDRYANLEVNALLQHMEAFDGVAILATNKKQAADRAFLRRFRHVVDFPA